MNNKGITIIELIAILVILGILSTIAFFTVGNIINNSKLKTDTLTLNSINTAVSYYNLNNLDEPINGENLTEEAIFNLLVSESYLLAFPTLQSDNASFVWSTEDSTFRIRSGEDLLPLSPYGDTFEEIAPKIIEDIHENYLNKGKYGRTWGDYRYTDVGLNPEDWSNPILHLYYVVSGSTLRINIESGYEAVFEKSTGEVYVLPSSRNYSIIYNDLDGLWYYHKIEDANQIDVTTLEIRIRNS